MAFGLSLDELGLFGDLRFVGSWAVFAAAHSKKEHIVMIWQGLWRIIIIMDVGLMKSEFGGVVMGGFEVREWTWLFAGISFGRMSNIFFSPFSELNILITYNKILPHPNIPSKLPSYLISPQ